MTEDDQWGDPLSAERPSSVQAWNEAWSETLHFRGDPFATLESANAGDAEFALGPVFCGTYRVLGAARLDDPSLAVDVLRATERARSPRDLGHVEALQLLTAGEFTAAGDRWDALARDRRDFAAVRFAHDVYLHVGDDARRLASSTAAMKMWDGGVPGWNHVAGMHAFSLEEAGCYDEAEAVGTEALGADPLDTWALHALAHVHEMRQDQAAALDLLRGRQTTWTEQTSLATHIWWHLCLRLMAGQSFDEVLAIYDELAEDPRTPFRFCDLASLLWRLELADVAVGDRWDALAASADAFETSHTSAFVELHLALAHIRSSDQRRANRFFESSRTAHAVGDSENNVTFQCVVEPLVDALRSAHDDPSAAVVGIDAIGSSLARVGGSIAQRNIIPLTRRTLQTQ